MQLENEPAAGAHGHMPGPDCAHCPTPCRPTPMQELMAMMKHMRSRNAANVRELAEMAAELERVGNHAAYEEVLAAVADFERGDERLRAVLSGLEAK